MSCQIVLSAISLFSTIVSIISAIISCRSKNKVLAFFENESLTKHREQLKNVLDLSRKLNSDSERRGFSKKNERELKSKINISIDSIVSDLKPSGNQKHLRDRLTSIQENLEQLDPSNAKSSKPIFRQIQDCITIMDTLIKDNIN